MPAIGRFAHACESIGLRFRSESTRHEPRFRLTLDAVAAPPCLVLVVRGDETITPGEVVTDPGLPGILLTILEQTVRKEPVMDLWLAHTVHHRHVVWQMDETWRLAQVPSHAPAATPAEAVRQVLAAADDEDPTA